MKKINKKNFSTSLVVLLVVLVAGINTASAAGITDGPKTATVNATIPESMALSCVNPSTLTIATVGTPVSQQGACTATTNAAAGFNIKTHRVNAYTLRHTDAVTTVTDTGTGLSVYDGTATSTALWTAGTTKGIGFRVQVSGTTNTGTLAANWGADGVGTAEYAAFPAADQTMYNYGSYSATSLAVNIDYKLDVPATQKSGSYSGTVQYTATTN